MTDYNYILTTDGKLYHHGIKGMKWGRRRYQNKDGSLTPAGKKRLAESIQKQAEGNNVNQRTKLLETVRKDLANNYKDALRQHVVDMKQAREKWLSLDTVENDYWDSGAAKKR